TALNDAPTNTGTLPTDITVTEDVSSAVDLSAIDLADVDAGSSSLTLTLSTSTGGNLSAAAGTGITLGGSGSASVTLSGSLTSLNAYLNTTSNITYLHGTANTFGSAADTINVAVNDNGNTGSGGGTEQALGTVNVNITPVNDSPLVGNNTGVTVAEGGSLTITTAMLNEADVDDAGAGLTYLITNGPMNGQLELTTNADVSISSFTQDDIDNNRVVFVHDGTQATADSIDFRLADGGEDGATPATGTFTFTVMNVNDAPEIVNLSGDTLTYTEGDGQQAIDQLADALVSDVDSSDFATGTLKVSFSTGSDSTDDVLSIIDTGNGAGEVGVSGNTVSYEGTEIGNFTGGVNGSALVITLNADTDVTAVSALIRQICYQNTNTDNPTTGNRTVQYVLTDGDGGISAQYDTTVNVTALNDAPANVGTLPTDITVTEDVSSAVDLSAIDLVDVDADNSSLTLTLSTSTGGNLSAAAGTGITLGGSGSASVTLSGSLTSLNTYLNTTSNINYLHGTANTFGSAADTIDIAVNDNGNTGSGGGTEQTIGTINVDINAVNDAPTLSTTAINPSFIEGGIAVNLYSGTSASTMESGQTLESLVLTISDVTDGANEILEADGSTFELTNGTSGSTVGNGYGYTVDLTGSTATVSFTTASAVPEAIESLVNGLAYRNTSDDPTTVSRVVAVVSMRDSGATENGGTHSSSLAIASTVTMVAINNAPVAVADSITASEAGGTVNSSAGTNPTGNVLANDTDADTVDTQTIVGVRAGTHPVASGSVGSSVTGAYGSLNIGNDGSYTYTLDNTNTIVQALPNATETITDLFTYTMEDSSGLSSTAQVTVTIQGNNDAPTLVSISNASVPENTDTGAGTVVGTLNTSDVDAGDEFSYSVVSSENAAVFNISGDGSNELIISDGVLDFESQPSYSVAIRSTDSAGLTHEQTLVISVIDVNEAPVIDNGAGASGGNMGTTLNISVDENQTVAVRISATDVDSNATQTYSLTGGEDQTAFSIEASTGALTFISPPDHEEKDSYEVEVTVTDNGGLSATQTVMINIKDVDEPPNTKVDKLEASENSVLIIDPLSSLLTNDSDPEMGALTLASFSQPQNGALRLNAEGLLEYIPDTDFVGMDNFFYEVEDAGGNLVSARVWLDVIALDDSANGPDDLTLAGASEARNEAQETMSAIVGYSTGTQVTMLTGASELNVQTISISRTNSHHESGTEINGTNSKFAFKYGQLNISKYSAPPNTMDSADLPVLTNEAAQALNSLRLQLLDYDISGLYSFFDFDLDKQGRSEQFKSAIIALRDQVDRMLEQSEKEGTLASIPPMILGATLTLGALSWVLSSGLLISATVTASPLWRPLDPIPILTADDDEDEKGQYG
ncbi:MAG: Ig-like domain-containing protein, partial [Granulosicoccus sp.]